MYVLYKMVEFYDKLRKYTLINKNSAPSSSLLYIYYYYYYYYYY
jgi:hypothetical protein